MMKTKSENRRALPKFLVGILLAGIGGGVLGFGAGVVNSVRLSEHVRTALSAALTAVGPWGISVTSVLFLGIGWGLYRQARNLYKSWDGEDEEPIDAAEQKLSWAMLMSALAMLADFFFLSVLVIYDVGGLLPTLGHLGLFLVSVAVIVVLQQKVVDLEKQINPEKRGSVYDFKFQKKWMESCDESEQRQIGQASYKAYQAVTHVCLWTWVALLIIHYAFDTGLLPMVPVLVIFGVMQITYTLESIRLSRKSSAE